MKNLKIGPRLITAFLIVSFCALLVGAFGVVSSSSLKSDIEHMYNEPVTAINAIADMRGNFQLMRVNMLMVARNASNETARNTYLSEVEECDAAIREAITIYDTTITDMSSEDDYLTFKDTYESFYKELGALESTAAAGGELAALALIDEFFDEADTARNAINAAADYNFDIATDTKDESTATANTLMLVQVLIVVAAVGISMGLAAYISKMITDPLKAMNAVTIQAGGTGNLNFSDETVRKVKEYGQGVDEVAQSIDNFTKFIDNVIGNTKTLEQVSQKNLTVQSQILSKDDTLGNAVNAMVLELRTLIEEVSQAAKEVSSSSHQLAEASQTMAEGSTEQAATVEQLSASVADISDKTKSNAVMAKDAAGLALDIKANAEKGNAQMHEMTQAVEEINNASHDISRVIKVIDDIAFQTNILALNAAVEAARAGEAGKGFAVVADEVRNLASKSAAAAKETGTMIENSMKKAEVGSQIAKDTAISLNEIVSGIERSSLIVAQISASAEEQQYAIEQINTGITQVSGVVQRNSALTEETAAASEEMNTEAQSLEHIITQFEV
ncbi:MAG: methyl-accepting chemotaxis protein [Ruminococcus sp.]|nr:methyl-accepting chemotaxis protein [Ruminococcus sp.]